MRIELTENYFIEQSTNAPHLWDLYRKRTAKEIGKQYETTEAYGLDLKQVAEKVPYFEILSKEGEVVALEEFVKEFESKQKEIISEFLKQVKESK
jgi:hypothetical protein